MSERTLGKARGLNSIADPSDYKGSRGTGRRRGSAAPEPEPERATADVASLDSNPPPSKPQSVEAVPAAEASSATSGRAGTATISRKRRELSIPLPVAEALNETGINPADVVMRAYRKYADSIYGGTGGRLVSKGRERLRLSISDSEFDKITRLGHSRGWNRSETVAVLLTLELLEDEE